MASYNIKACIVCSKIIGPVTIVIKGGWMDIAYPDVCLVCSEYVSKLMDLLNEMKDEK